jgi:CRP-like cAMP-binding protein
LLRLDQASFVASQSPGTRVVEGGTTSGMLTVVVESAAQACVTGPDGRRVTFKIAAGASVHGLIPLVDGKEMPNDVIALDKVTEVRIPHAALWATCRAPVLRSAPGPLRKQSRDASVSISVATATWTRIAPMARWIGR